MKKFTIQNASRVLSVLLVIILASVVTAGFGYQAIRNEAPCPLCLLQRVAMIGVAVGQLLNFRFGVKLMHHGISLLSCFFGAAISWRQFCLTDCPVFPQSESPLVGYSLYTWALITLFVLILIASTLLSKHKEKQTHSKFLKYLERFAFLYVLLVVIADIVIVMLRK
ncbi:MAG: disulfide bond formation protein B [Chlamydiales bacterium]|nr:disulfide bond formation protein B [Chlamydiales bacterium]